MAAVLNRRRGILQCPPCPTSPLPARDFNAQAAAHLLWRAGFGGTWEQAEELAALGLDGAVERLVNYPPSTNLPAPECAALPEETDKDFDERLKKLPDEEARQKERNLRYDAERARIRALQDLVAQSHARHRARQGRHSPLEEKLTLFWHSHFASSFEDKIDRTYPLWRQNQTFRAFAIGAFPDQLNALIRDPAMLVWSTTPRAIATASNENFARELMELFPMGVGHYSEKDVKESARALTGYGVERERWAFHFNEGRTILRKNLPRPHPANSAEKCRGRDLRAAGHGGVHGEEVSRLFRLHAARSKWSLPSRRFTAAPATISKSFSTRSSARGSSTPSRRAARW